MSKSVAPLLVACALTALSTAAPRAQEEGAVKLDPITISATKQPQELGKIDAMVGVATPEDMTGRNITNLNEIDRLFPDMLIRSRGNSAYSSVTIRGQSSVDFYNPSVQIYVDGLPQDQTTFGQMLPAGLEQVEVLYGPQGTLYGRSAVGGVINVVTRKPDDELRVFASAAYGNLERDVSLLASTPLVPGKLYGDIALGYQRNLGEYQDFFTGDEVGNNEDWNGRVRLRYAPVGGPLDIMVSAARDKLYSEEEQYVLAADREERIAYPVPSSFSLVTNSFGLVASYDLGFATLSSLTGYQDRTLDRTGFGSYQPEDQSTLSQELRLSSMGETFDYVAGGFFQYLDFERRVPALAQTTRQKIYTYAVFGEATWHATDRLDITGGLRFDYEKNHADATGGVTLTGDDSSHAISPKVALGYQLTDGLRAYALYSTGFKAGGFTRTMTVENIAFTYDPQTSHNFEVGLRGDLFGGRLQFTAAGYYTYTQDYQLFVGLQPYQYLQNAGDVEAKGFDLAVTAYPLDALRITAGLGLNDTTFVSYDNPANPDIDLKGGTVPYAPQVTANVNLEYAWELPGGLGTLVPHGGFQYIGRTYFDELNTIQQGGYALFDAGLSWRCGRITADAYVENIGDKTYATYGFDGGPYLGDAYQLGPGRSFGIRLGVSL